MESRVDDVCLMHTGQSCPIPSVEASRLSCSRIMQLNTQLLAWGLADNMKHILVLVAEKKFYLITVYSMMVILMFGAMLFLMVVSKWISSSTGITTHPLSNYDYIIVGGGTAGCVLAARLSADPNHSVLLLEAGHHFNWLSTIPLAAPLLQHSEHDWAYHTLPQQFSSWGLINQSSAWPRGRGLGGSGQMNYLLHFPGRWEDFDQWEMSGAEGWSLQQLRPYMARMLGNCSYTQPCLNSYHHVLSSVGICPLNQSSFCPKTGQGRLHVSQVDPDGSPLAKAFMDAAEVLRASGEDIHLDAAQSTVFKGQRWGSLDTFLRPALGRPNLHVVLDTQVSKVLISKENKALGVEVIRSDKHHQQIYAHQEIILSAGTVNSPQILLLSGVGPRQQLENFGIPVVSDLPVGQGLKDHLNLPLYVSITSPVSVTLDKVKRLSELWQYMIQGRGLLASSAIEGVGWAAPHLGFILFGLGSADEQLLSGLANFQPKTFQALFPFSNNSSQEGFVMLSSCLQPLSEGLVSLQSRDIKDAPNIDPQYLSHPKDVSCMVEAVRQAAKVVSSEPFMKLGAQLHLPHLEQCKKYEPDVGDLSYLECLVRTAAITGYHPTSTCRMGPKSAQGTVVDHLLRVHGVSNLRVMDASIFPGPVSGHPNSVLMAVADRAADLILPTKNGKCS